MVGSALSLGCGDNAGTGGTGDGGTTGDGGVPPGDGSSGVTGRWAVVNTNTTADLYGIYGTSGTELLAVGAFTTLRFNGTAWAMGPAPSSGETRVTLRAVHGVGANAFTVGNTEPPAGSSETGAPVVLRAMGNNLMESVHNAASAQLHSVWMNSASDGWIVGESTALRFNGMRWTDVSAMGLRGSSPTPDLYTVWSSGPMDAWAVGNNIFRWNGSAWAMVPREGSDFLFGVWGATANDVWIVGESVARRWNGTTLSEVRTGAQGRLYAVWGSGANDVWAVGAMGTIVHFDGARWSAVPSGTTQTLRAVWGRSGSDVWAVGEMGVCLHYTR